MSLPTVYDYAFLLAQRRVFRGKNLAVSTMYSNSFRSTVGGQGFQTIRYFIAPTTNMQFNQPSCGFAWEAIAVNAYIAPPATKHSKNTRSGWSGVSSWQSLEFQNPTSANCIQGKAWIKRISRIKFWSEDRQKLPAEHFCQVVLCKVLRFHFRFKKSDIKKFVDIFRSFAQFRMVLTSATPTLHIAIYREYG